MGLAQQGGRLQKEPRTELLRRLAHRLDNRWQKNSFTPTRRHTPYLPAAEALCLPPPR